MPLQKVYQISVDNNFCPLFKIQLVVQRTVKISAKNIEICFVRQTPVMNSGRGILK